MAEATLQALSTSLTGEQPFIGDLRDAEICVNVADGRIWAGDSIGTPVELGGAVKNSPIGPLLVANYLDVDVTSADNLPVSNPDPLEIPPGFYQQCRILLRFTQTPLENFQTYFDYPVEWGPAPFWRPDLQTLTWGGQITGINTAADNPIDFYKAQGRVVLVELSSFGPNPYWMGRVLWVNTISNSEQ